MVREGRDANALAVLRINIEAGRMAYFLFRLAASIQRKICPI